jgi:hypothetical protein
LPYSRWRAGPRAQSNALAHSTTSGRGAYALTDVKDERPRRRSRQVVCTRGTSPAPVLEHKKYQPTIYRKYVRVCADREPRTPKSPPGQRAGAMAGAVVTYPLAPRKSAPITPLAASGDAGDRRLPELPITLAPYCGIEISVGGPCECRGRVIGRGNGASTAGALRGADDFRPVPSATTTSEAVWLCRT